MTSAPSSAQLRDNLARLDDTIRDAQQRLVEAQAESHAAIASGIAATAIHPNNPFMGADAISAPSASVTAAASKLEEVLLVRRVAVAMLDRTLESERLAKQDVDRATLDGILHKQDDEAKQLDAATLALVNLIVSYSKTCDEAHRHMRHVMQIATTPGTPADEVAKLLGAAIARAVHWNAAPLEPIATLRAEKFARRARDEAGMA